MDLSNFKILLVDETKKGEWWDEYADYQQSEKWQRVRKQVMEEFDHSCQVCNGEATVAHHITYERLGNEKRGDLVALCNRCHHMIHDDKDFEGVHWQFIGGEFVPVNLYGRVNVTWLKESINFIWSQKCNEYMENS